MITRNDTPGVKKSYLVISGKHGPFAEGCGGWTAMRLPVLPFPATLMSDALPCLGWRLPEQPLFSSQAVSKKNSVEFVDEKGQRMAARWSNFGSQQRHLEQRAGSMEFRLFAVIAHGPTRAVSDKLL